MDKQSNALITFNDEPEDAISTLNGVACLLKMLADSADTGVSPYKHIGDACYTLGAFIEAATYKLENTIFNTDKLTPILLKPSHPIRPIGQPYRVALLFV